MGVGEVMPGRQRTKRSARPEAPGADVAAVRENDGLLSREEELVLVSRAKAGDRAAQERLISANIRLIYAVARRYRCRSFSLDDLVQEGVLGFMHAIRRFDEERGCRLSTYALHWVRQAITRATERHDRLIYIPAQTAADVRRLHRLREEMVLELGREPTAAELAEGSGLTEERVAQLLGTILDPVSLEGLVGPDQDASLLDFSEDPHAPNPEQGALLEAYQEQIRRMLCVLRPRERWVLEHRYGLNGIQPVTLDELSRQLNVSREGIRQIEARAIRKLRHALRSMGLEG